MISRLVLNLRTFDTSDSESTISGRRALDAPAFAHNRMLGNIGAPLDSDQWDAELFDDDVVHDEDPDFLGSDSGNAEGVPGNATDTMVPVVCYFSVHISSSFTDPLTSLLSIQIYEGGGEGDIEMVPISRAVWSRWQEEYVLYRKRNAPQETQSFFQVVSLACYTTCMGLLHKV